MSESSSTTRMERAFTSPARAGGRGDWGFTLQYVPAPPRRLADRSRKSARWSHVTWVQRQSHPRGLRPDYRIVDARVAISHGHPPRDPGGRDPREEARRCFRSARDGRAGSAAGSRGRIVQSDRKRPFRRVWTAGGPRHGGGESPIRSQDGPGCGSARGEGFAGLRAPWSPCSLPSYPPQPRDTPWAALRSGPGNGWRNGPRS
jgi:hypothetical protein